MMRLLFLFSTPLLLGGCINTIGTVVTAPVKAVGQAADWATTSQDEADRNRGRKLRAREEQLGKLARQQEKAQKNCAKGDARSCERAEALDQEIAAVMAQPI